VKGASLRDVAVVLAAIPARVYAAAALLAATLAVAVWLYTYRVSELYEYIDRAGTHYHPAERMSVQPWWSTPATIVVLVLGVAATISLLPKAETDRRTDVWLLGQTRLLGTRATEPLAVLGRRWTRSSRARACSHLEASSAARRGGNAEGTARPATRARGYLEGTGPWERAGAVGLPT
jgi:hypothetical protein